MVRLNKSNIRGFCQVTDLPGIYPFRLLIVPTCGKTEMSFKISSQKLYWIVDWIKPFQIHGFLPFTHNQDSTMSSAPLLQSAPGKRIALPTRVEPKVFFANERTFLSWLNFTVILGGLGVGLLNFGDKVGRISAGLFTLVAMATMGYALITYHWRAVAIRKRGSGPYDDRFGPTMLCFFLLAAVVVNFALRINAA